MSNDENSVPSPTVSKFSKLSNTTSKLYTPCRRVGLKRKSTNNTPSCTNILKKTKVISETVKRIKFDDGTTVINREANELVSKLNGTDKATIQKNIIDKRHEIEELRSELKNSDHHNLDHIQELSKKWLTVCQEALMSLFHKLNGSQNSYLHTIEDLIKHLDIDPDLIHFDSNNQEFY